MVRIAARAASLCSLVVLAALLGLSIFEGLGAARGTWRVVPVLSGSMAPRMPTGSAVLTWKTPLRQLHVGSVVAYGIPVGDHHVEMHRVTRLKRVPAGVIIKTKGDANSTPDPWSAHLSGTTFWRVGQDVPLAGWPIVYLQRPLIRLAATLAAAFGFLFSSRRRESFAAGDVVDVEVADAVVGALEEELAAERVQTRGAIESLRRRMDALQDESRHRSRMREVELVLAELADTAPPMTAGEPAAPSLVETLDERLATVRAGVTGLAA